MKKIWISINLMEPLNDENKLRADAKNKNWKVWKIFE